MPAVAIFTAGALAIALTAGFGLGVWLLLARTAGVGTFGVPWVVVVQVHGTAPLQFNYVNATDDPSRKKASKP